MQTRKLLIILLVIAVGLILVGQVQAADFNGQVERINKLYSQSSQHNEAQKSLEYLRRAEEICAQLRSNYSERAQSFWLSAENSYKLANYSKQPLSTLKQGKKYAQQAIEINSESARSYFWLATLMGRIGQEKGILNSLAKVKPMRNKLEKAIKYDADFAPAYDVMARLYMQAPGWPVSIGDKKQALKYRKKSVDLEPNNYDYLWRLANNYLKVNKSKQARETLQKLINLTSDSQQPEVIELNKAAQQKLNQLN